MENLECLSCSAPRVTSLDFQPRKVQGVPEMPGLSGLFENESAAPISSSSADSVSKADPSTESHGADGIDAGLDARLVAGLDASTEGCDGTAGVPLRVSPSFEPSKDVNVPSAQPSNPGSVGHPELCTRPCLYFAAGSCPKSECEFCHLDHKKRPARLDKRHRERLDRLSVSERIAVVLPVVIQRQEMTGLGTEQVQLLLSKLSTGEPVDSEKTKISRSLKSALEALSLRSLLTMLDCAPEVPAVFDQK